MNEQPDLTPGSADRAEEIFSAAVQLPAAERAGYLDRACAGRPQLRDSVESLLRAHEGAGRFLDEPAVPSPKKTVVLSLPIEEKTGDKIGRYKLLQQLGEGGCGVVYMAEQEEPVRRRVALKVIKLGMDTKQVIARFEAERQALALMDHPNIAKVLDAGATENGRPFFVMELVRGIRITDYCDQNKLSTNERLQLFTQVCHAIQHAHQKGIIHRDIKPSNILVTLHDGKAVPKVIDFGIAKATQGRLTDQTLFTAFEQFIGTPAYMSPEQAEMSGLDIDTRSDIYALGVLLYELLTGRTPFDPKELLQAGLDELRRTIREKEPARPSTRLSTMLDADLNGVAQRRRAEPPRLIHLLRGDLDWIVMKSLEKDRTRRYETASALSTDVQRHLNNEPVEARPPSTAYRFQKLVRRNRAAFAAIGTGLAALIIGLAVSLYLFAQERDAHRRAVAAEREQSRLREKAERTAALESELRLAAERSQDIGMAAFLLTQGKYEEAERAINQVPLSALPHIITNYPATAAIFTAVGEKHARHGEWPAAISNYSRVADAFPGDRVAFHQIAPLLAQVGDADGYRHHCEQFLSHFGGDSETSVAMAVGHDCLLLPLPAPSLQAIRRIADTAAKDLRTNTLADVLFVKGLVEYRLGNYSEARGWLEKAVATDGSRYHNMESLFALAMAQFQLKQLDQARQTLAEGTSYAARKLPKPGDDEFGDRWKEALAVQVLSREATQLIEDRSVSKRSN
jgi:serine/threonine protein kinase/Tfp pilus assembly protein PilF